MRFRYIDPQAVTEYQPLARGTPFLHGTQAPPFDRLAPGTCVTNDLTVATEFAERGSYYRPSEQAGDPRIVSLTVDLPDGAPWILMSSSMEEQLDRLQQEEDSIPPQPAGVDQDRLAINSARMKRIRAAYHREAMLYAIAHGLDAYLDGLYNEEAGHAMVIVNPDRVTIISQNHVP